MQLRERRVSGILPLDLDRRSSRFVPDLHAGEPGHFPLSLPAGRYLVSVLADGHKIDGEHFTVPRPPRPVGVTVKLQPYPLPAATIQAAVFEDISPVNGAPDLPAEHGLAGFLGKIADYLGDVTSDVFGNPLCTEYERDPSTGQVVLDADGAPVVLLQGGACLSKCYVVENGVDVGTVEPGVAGRCPTTTATGQVVEGKLKIPNLGPNRYALSIAPPNGSGWIQTTTLEGNLDWDAWVMEGATGLDTEFLVAGEPFPAVIFGYVPGPSLNGLPGGTGQITGRVEAVKIYVPTKGGVANLPGTIWGGLAGAKIDKPIPNPWVTLTDLTNGDTVVWIGRGDPDGTFRIPGVPAGNYTLTWWDEKLNYILDLTTVTVGDGEIVNMGILPLTGWWTRIEGYVFADDNRNGVMDPGEKGIPGYTLTMRKRENSLMDRGATTLTTDASGHYVAENAYPMTQWLVLEAYDDQFYTTGVTFQADNQPTPTTHKGAGVDVSVLPIIGLSGRIDWGKHRYDATGTNGVDPQNGGIVGTVTYDTTRNELDPQYSAAEDWQPGISGLTIELWTPVDCRNLPGVPCDPTGWYELAPDGSFAKGKLLNTYVTETWQRPTSCVARNVDGAELVHGVDENVLPLQANAECLEGPLMGVQFATYATDQGTPGANFGASVDGNYGFGDGCFTGNLVPDPTDPSVSICSGGTFDPLPAGDYLVEVKIPTDASGKAVYKVTREEDINIGNGDTFVPAVPPPACVGPLHIVDVQGFGTADGYPGRTLPNGITVPASTPTFNPTFVDIGGSPYEGQARPLCTTKLVSLQNGRSIVPVFNLFTDVPLPTRFWGLIVDDLTFSADPRSLLYGEKAGIPFAPVGIYDYTDRLITTVESDFNGLFDVLLPSSNRINCPTPSGVCANLYRFVGNDPGIPGRLNLNYRPEFRTIAAEFEAIPGLLVPADLAPTQVGVTVQLPGGQPNSVSCALDPASPQLFKVDRPYVSSAAGRSIVIQGTGFGASGQVTLDGTALPATAITSWSNTRIGLTIPTSVAVGPKQLRITATNGQRTANGITLHILGTGYNPALFEVGPAKTYVPVESLPASADHAIQRALSAAADFVALNDTQASQGALVVVYPNDPSANPRQNPRGAYYENLIISSRVKLQGVGPGSPDGSVRGSIIDGSAFAGDSPVTTDWYSQIGTLAWDGNQTIYDGAIISIYVPSDAASNTPAERRRAFPATYNARTAPSIDGFDLRGGNQQGFPGNINVIGGGPTGQPGGLVTQGGAIFANAFARNLQITNNVVQNNGGAYGTIRIGTPDLPIPDNQNAGVRIASNRILANAGTNLAGGIGIFAGASGYEVSGNDLCGNFSAEYGGGLSVYGYSPGGRIHHNRIYFNRSYDEGGGIMIAGQLPADPSTLSPGSGPVDIYANVVQANLANDDGGGIRFLMAGNSPMNVYNNFIVNNVSTHEGGGVSLNDAPNVRFFNNTVMKNLTTATAATSNGLPAPAGLSTSLNSTQLQAKLPGGAPLFSNPVLFNNIFWDNRAGSRAGGTVTGLGIPGDTTPIVNWDMGVADSSGQLSPTYSVLQDTTGTLLSTSNKVNADPGVVATYDTSVAFAPWRTNPAFMNAILVAVDLPPNLMGNYHLGSAASPAYNTGAASKAAPSAPLTVSAPAEDIDGNPRPFSVSAGPASYDMGADEFGSTGGVGTGGGSGGSTPTLPILPVLDNFNRANANTLGANWSQLLPAIRVNANQASDLGVPGQAMWNGVGSTFGSSQGAAFTFANTPGNNTALVLKASGGMLLSVPQRFVRVRYTAGSIRVELTSNYGLSYTSLAQFTASPVTGSPLTAVGNADGTVDVWLDTAYLGRSSNSGLGTGRIGIQLPVNARVDNFSGGTLP